MKNINTRGFANVAVVVIGLLLVGLGSYAMIQNRAHAPTTTPAVNTSDWKTYKNEKYGFEFKYPVSWKLQIKEAIVFGPNNIVFRLEVINDNEKFYLEVHDDESTPGYIYETYNKVTVDVGGTQKTLYWFPNGYECIWQTDDKPDCSFVVVPIKHNGLEYRLWGQRQTSEEINPDYIKIFSTFKFTK